MMPAVVFLGGSGQLRCACRSISVFYDGWTSWVLGCEIQKRFSADRSYKLFWLLAKKGAECSFVSGGGRMQGSDGHPQGARASSHSRPVTQF